MLQLAPAHDEQLAEDCQLLLHRRQRVDGAAAEVDPQAVAEPRQQLEQPGLLRTGTYCYKPSGGTVTYCDMLSHVVAAAGAAGPIEDGWGAWKL